ncbi:MAG: DPP IV N-terminal domain-containing protein [Bacteroidaceae bacterium]|nr:DPP IV N-terminal domain-containing protein [Bacteroidaceae bacterium]
MKKISSLILCLMAITTVMAQQKTLTLNDVMSGGSNYWNLQPEYIYATWWGNTAVETTVDKAVVITDQGGRGRTLFTTDEVNTWVGETVLRSCHNIEFPYPDQPLVRILLPRRIMLVNFDTHAVEFDLIIPDDNAQNLDWNSQSRNLAYTVGCNLVVLTADGQRIAVTTDGADDTQDIVYGQEVSRNEFGINKGTFWSPNGKKLAFYRKDQSKIPSYPQVDITTRIATTYVDKYPMAGEASQEVSVGVFDVETSQTVFLDSHRPKTDYMTNISWAPDGNRIFVFELNRDQDHMQLYGYNAANGQKEIQPLLEERHPRYVEPLNPLGFLPWDANKAVMQSRRDNWNHLYLIDLSKSQKGEWREADGGGDVKDFYRTQLLTPGDFEIINFLGFNEKSHAAIFVANADHPLRHGIYTTPLKGKAAIKRISVDDGCHTAQLSTNGTQLIDLYSSPTVRRSINLLTTANGKSVNLLTADDPLAGKYKFPEITSGSIKAADGETDLYYRLVKPVDFDESKKYPTVIYVYGGPHAHNVQASWGYYYRGWEIDMATRGYVVFVLDNRGSQYRGHKFESVIHRQLGVNEMADQMQGVEFLRSLPYVDTDRMGIHGWSFGGFMTTNLMLTYPEVFKVGVAGGPVIDWKFYEVMYGERYMDTPEQNPEGYANCGLLQKAANLKGRLQIIIGGNDPICVPQHSLSFIRKCEDVGTQPDFFIYPGDGHNMFGTDQVHLHERITRYFEDYLK